MTESDRGDRIESLIQYFEFWAKEGLRRLSSWKVVLLLYCHDPKMSDLVVSADQHSHAVGLAESMENHGVARTLHVLGLPL